jgi:TetR/AcrR family transcriptional repressor of nem operon
LEQWQARVERCLLEALKQKTIPAASNCAAIAEYFWIGWEGAVTRARLVRSGAPLDLFTSQFLNGIQQNLANGAGASKTKRTSRP